MAQPHLGVIGATGLVGRQVVSLLFDRDYPQNLITLLSSDRAEGEELDYGDDTLPVEKLSADALRGVQVALLAVPAAVAGSLSEQAVRQGALVVDLSGAANANAVRLAPGFNDEQLAKVDASRVVSLANPFASALAQVAKATGAKSVRATLLVGASVKGQGALRAFEKQTADLLNGREPDSTAFFTHRLGFNVVPLDEPGIGRDFTALLPQVTLQLSVLQVPLFHGSLLDVSVEPALGPDALKAALSKLPGFKLIDAAAEADEPAVAPMPMLVVGDDAVHAGQFGEGRLLLAVDPVARAAKAAVEVADKLSAAAQAAKR